MADKVDLVTRARMLKNLSVLLKPGLGIKRWLIIVLLGVTFVAVGAAFWLLDLYRTAPDTWWLPVISTASLRFLPRWGRVLIFGSLGLSFLGWGIWEMNRSIIAPFLSPGKPVLDTITSYRRREKGPRIVTIGGGTGLSTMLRGLKAYTHNLAAVVTVADDGGSSGRLREGMGILPPGDIRNCLAALSNDEALLSQLFQYRFPGGATAGLEGHSFGNLFISAMTEITGSFEEAIAESGRVLAVYGRVFPSTLEDVHLVADITPETGASEVRVKGESRIPLAVKSGFIRHVWIEPNAPKAFPKVIQQLLKADVIVIGPGSLYTSVLPNLLVPEIAAAIKASRAFKVYVCNIATQRGETFGYDCAAHYRAIDEHVGADRLFDLVIVNQPVEQIAQEANKPFPKDIHWVTASPDDDIPVPVYRAMVADQEYPWRHDADKLARVIVDLYLERTGPMTL